MSAGFAVANTVPSPVLIKTSRSGVRLGGGIRGYMPKPIIDSDHSESFSNTRFTLREAWNTNYLRQLRNTKRIITPFRAVTNAGDVLSRLNYTRYLKERAMNKNYNDRSFGGNDYNGAQVAIRANNHQI